MCVLFSHCLFSQFLFSQFLFSQFLFSTSASQIVFTATHSQAVAKTEKNQRGCVCQ